MFYRNLAPFLRDPDLHAIAGLSAASDSQVGAGYIESHRRNGAAAN